MTATPVSTFSDLRQDALNKTILKGPYGRAWQRVMGEAWDEQIDRMYQARRARWPDYCPVDGLFYIGVERGLERVFFVGVHPKVVEDEKLYRRRLREAWTIWRFAGTQEGHRESFRWAGLNAVSVWRRKEWNSPPEQNVSAYLKAFQRAVWAQFDVLVDPSFPFKPLNWAGWTYGNPVTWGTDATPDDVSLLRRLGRKFRSGHDTFMWIVVNNTGGRVWGSWLWGSGAWTPGVGQPTRWLVGEPHWTLRGLA